MSNNCDDPAPRKKKQKLDSDEGQSSMEVDDEKKGDYSAHPKYSDFVTPEEVENLKVFKILDEVKGDNSEDEGSVSSDGSVEMPADEIEQMLDEDLPETFKGAPKPKEKPYVTSQKIVLEEKGVNHFEVLPLDWVMVRHYSGMPVYLHRSSRVCTLAKPYCIGTGNARRHDIPISAIPCLYYRRALEEEEKHKEIDRKRAEHIKKGTWDHLISQAQNCPNKNTQGIAKNYIRNVITNETMKFYDPKASRTKVRNIENRTTNVSKTNDKDNKNLAVNKDTVKNNEINNVFQSKSYGNSFIETDSNISDEVNKDVIKTTDELESVKKESKEANCPFFKNVSKYSENMKSNDVENTLNDDNTQLSINVSNIEDLINENSISTYDNRAYNNNEVISVSKIDMSEGDNTKNAKFTIITKDDSLNTDKFLNTTDSNNTTPKNDNSKNTEFTAITKDIDSQNTDIHADNTEKMNSSADDSNKPELDTDNSTNNKSTVTENLHNIDDSSSIASNIDNIQNKDTLNADNLKTGDSTKDPASEFDIPLSAWPVILPGGMVMSPPRVENVNSSWKTQHLSHEQVNEYCKKLFKFKTVHMMHFKRWADKRKYAKARRAVQWPAPPPGTSLVAIPAAIPAASRPEGDSLGGGSLVKSSARERVMLMDGHNPTSQLHEYVRRVFHKQPDYVFRLLGNASAPYQATVYIGGVQYGGGRGASKREAKANAARDSIHILRPELRLENEDKTEDDSLAFFDKIPIEEPRIAELCSSSCEPTPHQLLRTCLARNFGTDAKVDIEMKKLENQHIELTMKVGKHSASVECRNKKTAKQRASQAILQALHPHIKSWGSILRLYGSRSVKSSKENKQEEQEITLLQDEAKRNAPNYAVLQKLRTEMQKLKERDAALADNGTLLMCDDLPEGSSSCLNNVVL